MVSKSAGKQTWCQKLSDKKYIITDADADDLYVNERSDDDEKEEIGCAPTANFSVRYSKSLTVGVKKKNSIPLCDVAHELTSRTYGEKKWWVVIVKDE